MAKTKYQRHAFLRGFVEGFAAPVCFFGGAKYQRARQIDASVDGAWRSVGNALRESYEGEIARNGKTTGKEKQRPRIIA